MPIKKDALIAGSYKPAMKPRPKPKATAANRERSVPGKMTDAVAQLVLNAYATGITLRAACKLANISTVAFQQYRKRNPDIELAWKEAEELNTCALEQRAHELALEADSRSPTMLIFMLKARRPSVYRDNVAVQGTMEVSFAASFAVAMEAMTRGVSSSSQTH